MKFFKEIKDTPSSLRNALINTISKIVKKKASEKKLTRKINKCLHLIDNSRSALENGDTQKAKLLYCKARKLYSRLNNPDKLVVYNDILKLYNDCSEHEQKTEDRK